VAAGQDNECVLCTIEAEYGYVDSSGESSSSAKIQVPEDEVRDGSTSGLPKEGEEDGLPKGAVRQVFMTKPGAATLEADASKEVADRAAADKEEADRANASRLMPPTAIVPPQQHEI
jgi:hypothetical protein